jgi:hypothetical protein
VACQDLNLGPHPYQASLKVDMAELADRTGLAEHPRCLWASARKLITSSQPVRFRSWLRRPVVAAAG